MSAGDAFSTVDYNPKKQMLIVSLWVFLARQRVTADLGMPEGAAANGVTCFPSQTVCMLVMLS